MNHDLSLLGKAIHDYADTLEAPSTERLEPTLRQKNLCFKCGKLWHFQCPCGGYMCYATDEDMNIFRCKLCNTKLFTDDGEVFMWVGDGISITVISGFQSNIHYAYEPQYRGREYIWGRPFQPNPLS